MKRVHYETAFAKHFIVLTVKCGPKSVWSSPVGLAHLTRLDVGGSDALLVTQPFYDMVSRLTQLSVQCSHLQSLQNGQVKRIEVGRLSRHLSLWIMLARD